MAPVQVAGRSQSNVPVDTVTAFRRSLAASCGRPGKLPDRDAREARLLGVDDGQLLAGRRLDHLSDAHDVGPFVGGQPESEPVRVGDGVEHAAVGHVHRHGPERGHLDRRVEMGREGRHVPEGDRGDLPVPAVGAHPDEPGGCLERQLRDRLGHRQSAGLEQDRHDADRVAAGHPGVLDLLHDHVPCVGLRVRGRQDEVAVGRGEATRLAHHPEPEVVPVGRKPGRRLEHRAAGDAFDPRHDHAPRLAGGVGIDRLDHGPDPQATGDLCRHGSDGSRTDASVVTRPRGDRERATAPYRPRCASASSRATSRRASRSAMSRRRSWSCLPRASPSSIFARPRSLM